MEYLRSKPWMIAIIVFVLIGIIIFGGRWIFAGDASGLAPLVDALAFSVSSILPAAF
jgi:hypothetical protein